MHVKKKVNLQYNFGAIAHEVKNCPKIAWKILYLWNIREKNPVCINQEYLSLLRFLYSNMIFILLFFDNSETITSLKQMQE